MVNKIAFTQIVLFVPETILVCLAKHIRRFTYLYTLIENFRKIIRNITKQLLGMDSYP